MAKIEADVFFSQTVAFNNVIGGFKNDIGLKGDADNGHGKEKDRISILIEELQKRQSVLKSLAETNKLNKEKELKKEREALLSRLNKRRQADLCGGRPDAIEELRQTICKAGLTLSISPYNSSSSSESTTNFASASSSSSLVIFRLGVIDLVSVEIILHNNNDTNSSHSPLTDVIKQVIVTSPCLPSTTILSANELFLKFLRNSQFEEFVKYLKGWISTYNVNSVDSVKIRSKLLSAMNSIVLDIEALNKSFIDSIQDKSFKTMLKTGVHGTPCGLFKTFPEVPKPILKFFVNPYDVMKIGKTMESDISEVADLGIEAFIEFQSINSPNNLILSDVGSTNATSTLSSNNNVSGVVSSSNAASIGVTSSAVVAPPTTLQIQNGTAATGGSVSTPGGTSSAATNQSKNIRKLIQTSQLVTSVHPLKLMQTLNNNNSSLLNVAFCLTFTQQCSPFPIFDCYIKELQEYTKSGRELKLRRPIVLVEKQEPQQWLYALSVKQAIIPDYNHEYSHRLPNCDLRAKFNLSACCHQITSPSCTYLLQGILFTHVNPLPHIIHILRKQSAMNSLIGELMRKESLSGSSCVTTIEVIIPSVDVIQLRFSHPLKKSCLVTITVEVVKPAFANPTCSISASDDVFICDDSYATTILRKCGSLAHLTRCILRKCVSLNVDVNTSESSSTASKPTNANPPPLTPTIDVKSVISFDRNIDHDVVESHLPHPTVAHASHSVTSNVRCTSATIGGTPHSQSSKLVDMLQNNDSISSPLNTFDDVPPPPQISVSNRTSAGTITTTTTTTAASTNRKRSRVKSSQEDGQLGSPAGKVNAGNKNVKAVKRSMSVAAGGVTPTNNNPSQLAPSLQLQQQIQMLSMMPLLPLPMMSQTPSSEKTFSTASLLNSQSNISSPLSAGVPSSAPDSKLREILNSPKAPSSSTPVTPTSHNPLTSGLYSATNFEQLTCGSMPPTATSRTGTPPAFNPMQEFVLTQQAAIAAAQYSNLAAYTRHFKPPSNMYPNLNTDNSLSYTPPTPQFQSFLQPNFSVPMSTSESKSISASPITPSSTPDVSTPSSSFYGATSSVPSLSTGVSPCTENDKAVKYLGELIKQLDNKNNLTNSEIEAIERQMNQIKSNLALKDATSIFAGEQFQPTPHSQSGAKRKPSFDYTDSSSVSSNQSWNESVKNNNSNDSVFSATSSNSTLPLMKKSKNSSSGPPKRRGRPPKSAFADAHSPNTVGQFNKFQRYDSQGVTDASSLNTSPVKLLKLPSAPSGSRVKSDLDAFEMSDDSSDSNNTLQISVPAPPPVVHKKPAKVTKRKNTKKGAADSISGGTEQQRGSTTTTYKSLNKSDTVIVIKKLQVTPTSSSSPFCSTSQTFSTATTITSKHEDSPSTSLTNAVGNTAVVATSLSTSTMYQSSTVSDSIKEDTCANGKTLDLSMHGPNNLTVSAKSSPPPLTSSTKECAVTWTCPTVTGTSNSGSVLDLDDHNSAKHSMETKSSPMKNLFASFAAESSAAALSSQKVTSEKESSNSHLKSSSISTDSSTSLITAQSISSTASLPVKLSDASHVHSKLLSNTSTVTVSPTKKRPGLESVVNKLLSPGSSGIGAGGSSSTASSTLTSSHSTSNKNSIVAATLLKSPSSLKFPLHSKSSSSETKSKHKSGSSSEKSKFSSVDKSSTKNANSKPGSPIASTTSSLPAFLKSSKKLSNFVIPKKKSSGNGGAPSVNVSGSNSDHHSLGATSNSNQSSHDSIFDALTTLHPQPKKKSSLTTPVTESTSTSSSSYKSKEHHSVPRSASAISASDHRMFDFPLNDESSMPLPLPLLTSKSSSTSKSSPTVNSAPTSVIVTNQSSSSVSHAHTITTNGSSSSSSSSSFTGKNSLFIPLSRCLTTSSESSSTSSSSNSKPTSTTTSTFSSKTTTVSTAAEHQLNPPASSTNKEESGSAHQDDVSTSSVTAESSPQENSLIIHEIQANSNDEDSGSF